MVGRLILGYLDDRSLFTCRLVNKQWQIFIEVNHIIFDRIKECYEIKAGFTEIHIAAWTGQYQAYLICITKEQEINPKDDRGRTPLHFAALG